MKALLHLGDQERILRFAMASRSQPVYLLAAQWLQASGAWLRDEAALKQVAHRMHACMHRILCRSPQALFARALVPDRWLERLQRAVQRGHDNTNACDAC